MEKRKLTAQHQQKKKMFYLKINKFLLLPTDSLKSHLNTKINKKKIFFWSEFIKTIFIASVYVCVCFMA